MTQLLENTGRAHRGRASIAVLLVVALGVIGACSDEPLPLEEWVEEWTATVDRVHSVDLETITERDCEEMLTFLREQKPPLTPPPVDDLNVPVDAWFSEAESVFFDCRFPESELDSLRTLEAEIQAVLQVQR